MEITIIYAIAAGGSLAVFVSLRIISQLLRFTSTISVIISKHLTYPYFLGRHRLAGPWTRAGVILHLFYTAVNLFSLCFQASSITDAGRRAGRLSLINMVVLFAGSPLSLFADALGVSLRVCRLIHRAAAWMASILLIFHSVVIMIAKQGTFSLHNLGNLLTAIGSGFLGLILLFSLPCIRQSFYEVFLRAHQALAGFVLYAIWRHLPSNSTIPHLYVPIMVGLYLLTVLFQILRFLYQNRVLNSHGSSRVLVTRANNEDGGEESKDDNKAINIRVILSQPVKLDAGQYIYLWLPSATFWSWAQSHPFMVTSWSHRKQDSLELFVQPRRGLSAGLFHHAYAAGEGSASIPAFISGPHGISESVNHYETILAVASGFGIAAVIPYLKMLIYSCNKSLACARRLHFVWQLQTLDLAIAAQSMLNSLLKDDTLDQRYILTISLFVESGVLKGDKLPFGDHERACVYYGRPNYREIIQTEVSGDYIKRLSNIQEERGEALVMVSASANIRDHVRCVVRDYLGRRVRMSELEFQP